MTRNLEVSFTSCLKGLSKTELERIGKVERQIKIIMT